MKKIFFLSLFIFISFSTIAQSVVGKWKVDGAATIYGIIKDNGSLAEDVAKELVSKKDELSNSMMLEFKEDGTYQLLERGLAKQGTWKLSSESKILTMVKEGKEEQNEVLGLSQNSLVLKSSKFKIYMIPVENEQEHIQAMENQMKGIMVKQAEDKEVYTTVEQAPVFPGGMSEFYKYISSNIQYPDDARKANAEGKVFISFIINRVGELENVEIVKDIGWGCGEEALRIVKNSPRWIPGMQKGVPVKVKMSLPINFKLH